MRKALMIGSTVADVMIRVDHLPALEEDVNPYGQTVALGGCCYNAANVLSLYGLPFTLFSPVGTGVFGTFVKNRLEERGIEPVLCPNEENGCCYCIVDREGNRTFLALHGAEYLFRREWFDALDPECYSDAYVCGLELEDKTGDVITEFLQRNPHLNVYFAPSSRILHIPEDRMQAVLDCSPILHLNRREADMWLSSQGHACSEADTPALCRMLYERTRNTVIVTDGIKGAYAFDGARDYRVGAFPAVAVDGTGAGDSHIGTVMSMRMKGASLEAALRAAAVVSAQVVACSGAIPEIN